MPSVDGFVKPGFENVLEIYKKNIESGIDKGSNFAAYYKGELVVNIWGGVCDSRSNKPWTKDTLSSVYSATKACTAFVIAHLVERGLLDYDEKVSKYWPEFAQKGKENVTLKQLISHSAGLPNLDEPFFITEITDDFEGLSKKLAAQEPFWTPGDGFGYHAITFALYMDVLIRRADTKHRSLETYFQEEFAGPLGAEFYIGLPKDQADRATYIKMYDDSPPDMEEMMGHISTYGDKEVSERVFGLANPKDMLETDAMNKPEIRCQPCGSAHGHCAAKGLAKIYSAIVTGQEVNGKPLLSSESVERFMTPVMTGFDKCFAMPFMMAVGTLVFNVVEDGDFDNLHKTFGHGGFGGQIAFGDTKYKVAVVYTCCDLKTSLTGVVVDQRSDPLSKALYEAIFKLENLTKTREEIKQYNVFEERFEEYKKNKAK